MKDSPGSKRGLGSRIGTFTHPTFHAEAKATHRQAEMADLARKIRRIRERIAKRIRQIRTSLPVGVPELFCPVCGCKIPYNGEESSVWGKRRRCDSCLAAGRIAGDSKYCRQCGQSYAKPIGADPKSWNGVSLCPACRENPKKLETRVIIPEDDAELIQLNETHESLMAQWQELSGRKSEK